MADKPEQILQNLRTRLVDEERAFSEASATVELDQTRQGRLTRMDALQAQQMAVAASRRRRQRIQQIDAALRRVQNGEYGECLTRGEEIDPRRLEIDPTSTRCMPCLEKNA
ncbi:MAG: TraR/DksA C4-type zinc finger protein [Pseudomonadota bacterium]